MSSPPIFTERGEYSVLMAALPGRTPEPAGILLLDPAGGTLHIRLRRDWDEFAGEEAGVLALLEEDLEAKAREMGGAALLGWLEDSLSHMLRLAPREPVLVRDYPRALNRLYNRHVPTTVRRFATHLPLYSARAAAGFFLEDQEVEAREWIEAPPRLRLDDKMFLVRIQGQSMEPRIPDGSLCIFRAGVAGSREGKLVLVENRGVSESGGRYSVKRYHSRKERSPEGGWRHDRIRLESLNPGYPSWDLTADPDRYRIVGEFLDVLAEDPAGEEG